MFLIPLYRYFERHKLLFYATLCCLFLACGFLACQIHFVEDITQVFPQTNNKTSEFIFKTLKSKDKIIVLFSTAEDSEEDPDLLVKAGQEFREDLERLAGKEIRSIYATVNEDAENLVRYIYRQLPVYLSEKEYDLLAKQLTKEGINQAVKNVKEKLQLPIDQSIGSILRKDPLGLGSQIFSSLGQISSSFSYEIYEEHLFSEDLRNMVFFINPLYGIGQTSQNRHLIRILEKLALRYSQKYEGLEIHFCGGPTLAVHNAGMIQRDIKVTLFCAAILISLLTWFAFRKFSSLFLIIIPVAFGGVFALAIIWILFGSMSTIALGAGAVVFGIASSYSIHIINHSAHGAVPEQIIKELTLPLTIGSFTTIGAFIGLMFTSSGLLRDFGLFSALALVGTTLFCLIFLPHFLPDKGHQKIADFDFFTRLINRICRYRYEKNYWIIGGIVICVSLGIWKCGDVRFDGDLSHLNDTPEEILKTEEKVQQFFNTISEKVFFSIRGDTLNDSVAEYLRVCKKLQAFEKNGKIQSFSAVDFLLVPDDLRLKRIEKWNRFWTPDRKAKLKEYLAESSSENGFTTDAFDDFTGLIENEYSWNDLPKLSDFQKLDFSESWIDWGKEGYFCLCQLRISAENKAEVYAEFAEDPSVIVLDRGYFSNMMVGTVTSNFNLVLWISSMIVFATLLISYGRLELACLSFLPMNISFLIILGLMALFDIPFNIVNIILCTFIYGIGDDFSIFVMDGLITKYRENKDILTSHKTAVFLSSAVTLIGMGVLAFARHPSLHPIGTISILGMASVVLVSFTVQPFLFHLFIDYQTEKGEMPYTICSIIRTGTIFGVFVLGCLLVRIFFVLLFVWPMGREKKDFCYHKIVRWAMRFMLSVLQLFRIRPTWEMNGENFSKPALIIFNHQSFLDILIALSLHPKTILLTKKWVWNSPFFGSIARTCNFYSVDEGYDRLAERLIPLMREGYFVAIFPEGTRSENDQLNRFHKGAFYLAERLECDIVSVILYGTGHGCHKRQSMFIRPANYRVKVLPRIRYNDISYGHTYQERQKKISQYIGSIYKKMKSVPRDPYFHYTLIRNYIYKGPVLEWYTRIKVRMEMEYQVFNDLIPKEASIVDVGCGYGMMGYMLMLFSDRRKYLGLDYDREKIETASNCFLIKNKMYKDRIHFVSYDALDYDYSQADVFVLSDILHYMNSEDRKLLLSRCMEKLNPCGKIIIRDGNSMKKKSHKETLLTEFISTKVTHFNQIKRGIHFFNSEFIETVAQSKGFWVRSIKVDNITSNTIFILERKENRGKCQ